MTKTEHDENPRALGLWQSGVLLTGKSPSLASVDLPHCQGTVGHRDVPGAKVRQPAGEGLGSGGTQRAGV